MKNLLLFFILLSTTAQAQNSPTLPFINPSGYYSLDKKTTIKNGETYGYFGTMKVKLVDSNRIFADFYICKGAPGYNSGSFSDTLLYKNNIAIYTTAADNSCIITFNFNATGGVDVDEKTKDSAAGCGFGKGVLTNGFYTKVISANSKPKKQ